MASPSDNTGMMRYTVLRRYLKEHLFANSTGIRGDMAVREASAWAVKSNRETVEGSCSLCLALTPFLTLQLLVAHSSAEPSHRWNYTSG